MGILRSNESFLAFMRFSHKTQFLSCPSTMIYNKGGKSNTRVAKKVARIPRRSYSFREKTLVLSLVEEKMKDEKLSFAQAAQAVNVPPGTLYRWRADDALPDLSDASCAFADKAKHHPGPEGFLEDIKEELVTFITEWRDRGLPVSRFAVLQKATQHKPALADKSLPARYMIVSRFLHQNNLVHRLATHTSQKPPEAACEDARSYLKLVRPMLLGRTRHPRWTINMDQTNQFYGSSPKLTLDVRGQRTVNMRKGGNDSHRCTVALTVTAAGNILPPYIVYKGTEGGTIHRRELPDHPSGAIYTVQKKAWFDERVMLHWVEHVLRPYVATAPVGVIPIIFLDSFKVHLLGSVANAIQNIGVQLEYIPPGCTGLVQPIDVGINKPYKASMTKVFTSWLLDQDPNNPIRAAKREDVSAWILQALAGITDVTVKNAWRKSGYSYYE